MPRERENRISALRVAIAAGIAAAAIEMVFVLPIQDFLGASPVVVFQSIASGALGKAAFHEGLAAAGLGLGIHLFISLVGAGVYVLGAQRWPALLRRAAVCGMVYGVLVYVIMTFVVVPLSAIGFRPPRSLILMLTSLAVHVFAFGLPISLVVGALLGARSGSQSRETPHSP